MAETDITKMSSDYADNELELFRNTVSSATGISSLGWCHRCCMTFSGQTPSDSDGPDRWLGERPGLFHRHPQQGRQLDLQKIEEEWDRKPLEPTGAGQMARHGTVALLWEENHDLLPWWCSFPVHLCLNEPQCGNSRYPVVVIVSCLLICSTSSHTLAHTSALTASNVTHPRLAIICLGLQRSIILLLQCQCQNTGRKYQTGNWAETLTVHCILFLLFKVILQAPSLRYPDKFDGDFVNSSLWGIVFLKFRNRVNTCCPPDVLSRWTLTSEQCTRTRWKSVTSVATSFSRFVPTLYPHRCHYAH